MCDTQYNTELYTNNSLQLKQIIRYYYNLKIINQRVLAFINSNSTLL